MRALLLCALVAGVVGAGLFACNPNSIGRPCINPSGNPVVSTQIASPALECPSRLCLLQPSSGDTTGQGQGTDGGVFRATCTAECQSNGDCSPETTQYCKAGFACAVAAESGPFCCRKLCICKTDLEINVNVDADGGTVIPFSCSADNTSPSCPNAPVR